MHRQLKSVLLAVEIILSLTTGSFFHVLVALPGQERLVWPSGGGDDEASSESKISLFAARHPQI